MTIPARNLLGNSISHMMYMDNSIEVFTIESALPTDMRHYVNAVLDAVPNMPQHDMRLVLDLRHIALTEHHKRALIMLAENLPAELNGRIAIIVARNLTGYNVRSFGQDSFAYYFDFVMCEFFFNLDDAADWLMA